VRVCAALSKQGIRQDAELTNPGFESIVHMHDITEWPMPRPRKRRLCRAYEGDRVFKPRSVPMYELETVRLELSELEAMRLCDLDGLDQEAAGQHMAVSRGTVQRLLKSGRAKVLQALLQSRALLIAEGAHHEDLYTDRG
jgi:predicted DNA-binding protein (UPF0251 family)